MMTAVERKTIAAWRKEQWMTQKELADKAGVTLKAVSAWEQGAAQPRFSNMRALAAALGITPDQIILVHKEETS